MKAKINKIGFEVEGEMHPRFADELQRMGSVGSDGSIHTCREVGAKCTIEDAERIEFRSRPIAYADRGKLIEILDNFQTAAENKQFHYNKSCGFHIHFSFAPKIPSELYSIQFVRQFHKNLQAKFPEVWDTRSKNRYCRAQSSEEHIARAYLHGDDRYRSVNFSAMARHGTIEFRIWPSDNPLLMQKYLLFTIAQINNFIRTGEQKLHRRITIKLEDKEKTEDISNSVGKKEKTVDANRHADINPFEPYTTPSQILTDEEIRESIANLSSYAVRGIGGSTITTASTDDEEEDTPI